MKRFILLSLFLVPNLLLAQKLVHVESKAAEDSVKAKYYFHEAIRNKFMQNYAVSYELLKRCIAYEKDNLDYYYELSIVSYNLHKVDEALSYASKAYYGNSSNKYYALQYAQVLAFAGKNLEAVWVYQKIVNSKTVAIEDFLNLAFLYQKVGDLPNALKTLNVAEALYGIQDVISGSKIDILTKQKNYDDAIVEAKRLVLSDSTNIRYRLMLYDTYLAAGKIQLAKQELSDCYLLDSTNALVLLNLSNFYLVTGNIDLYFTYLNQLIASNGAIEDIYQLLSKLLTNPQVAAQSVVPIQASLGSLVNKFGNNPLIADLKSQVNILKGNYAGALDNLKYVVHSEYSSEMIWERYLSIELQLQRHDSIAAITDSLVNVFVKNPFIPFIKAIAVWQQGKAKLAIEILKKYEDRLAYRPSLKPDYYSTMGDIFHEIGRKKLGYKMYDKVLAINPNQLGVLNNYSYFLSVDGKNLDDALKMSRITINQDPNNSTFLDTYGWILFKLKRYNEAESFIRQAIVNGADDNAEVLEHYGDTKFMLGNIADALTYWKMSLKIEPERKGLMEKISKKHL
ncbi:MAG TPA: hypothetical protein VMW01_12990 [Williamwhitmania sp.]|nr:hypothetical protein [Williamwhitmania sp.]